MMPVVDDVLVDHYRDASKARLIWDSSRHYGCPN